MRPIEQRIADLDAKKARLTARRRIQDTRQKVLVGVAMIGAATDDPAIASLLADVLRKRISREIDRRALDSLLLDLEGTKTAPPSEAVPQVLGDLDRAALVKRRPGR